MQDHIKELRDIAVMYYNKGLTQKEIATYMNYSRPTISRMLTEARVRGIVTIYISDLRDDLYEIEMTLRKYFKLKEVNVVSMPQTDTQVKREIIGKVAAQTFIKYLRSGQTIGLGWGKTLFETARALPEIELEDCTICQLCGNIDTGEYHNFAHNIIETFSRRLGIRDIRTLPCPIVMDNKAIVDAICSDEKIQRNLKLPQQCDLMIVNIAELSQKHCLYVCNYIDDNDLTYLSNMNTEGSVCSRFIDYDGMQLESSIDERTISVSIEDIKNAETVMTCVFGKSKAAALYNALAGELIDVLVVDLEVALALIDLYRSK